MSASVGYGGEPIPSVEKSLCLVSVKQPTKVLVFSAIGLNSDLFFCQPLFGRKTAAAEPLVEQTTSFVRTH